MSINRVVLSGNMTRDPEIRTTGSGMPVLSFGIAVNDRRKNGQTGEWEDYPNFIDCTMFGTRAESVSRFLHKGSKIALEGKLRYSSWEKDGQKRSKLEVVVDEIELMSARDNGGNGGYQNAAPAGYVQAPQQGYGQAPQQYGGYSAAAPATPAAQPAPVVNSSVYDEDIPF